VASEPGRATRFEFTLPIEQPARGVNA